MLAIAAAIVWLLLYWRAPTGPAGALADLVVGFYRPMLWAVLLVVTLALLTPLFVWVWRRARSRRV